MAGLILPASSKLRYYGYYAARLTGDSHLAEVAGRSNLNWVNISDVDGYAASVLDGRAAGSCVVNTGNEFFSCDWYCQPFSVIQQKLTTLESLTSSS
jgi:hypothetical protein